MNNKPITSYGIILYTFHKGSIKYLLCQRRDTIEYVDFLRGRYSNNCISLYLNLMTIEERNRISMHTFDQLWNDLWASHDCKYYKDLYIRSKQKFNTNRIQVLDILNREKGIIKEPRWGFPKGKKIATESEIECSMREFKEETNLNLCFRNIIVGMTPSTETFKGSNGKIYKTVYYIAKCDKTLVFKNIKTDSEIRPETISDEIGKLYWATLDESKQHLPIWRYKLLEKTEKKILINL